MNNISKLAYEAFVLCETEEERGELALELHEMIEDARADAAQYREDDS